MTNSDELRGYLAEYSELRAEIRHYLDRRASSTNFALAATAVAAALARVPTMDASVYGICALLIAFIWFDETRRIRAVYRVAAFLRLFIEPNVPSAGWETLGRNHPVQKEQLTRAIAGAVFPATFTITIVLMLHRATWTPLAERSAIAGALLFGVTMAVLGIKSVRGAAEREEKTWREVKAQTQLQEERKMTDVTPPDDATVTHQRYIAIRNDYLGRERAAGEKMDKVLLTGAGGALALSLGFLEKIAPTPHAETIVFLAASWVLLLISLGVALVSYEVRSLAFARAREACDAASENPGKMNMASVDRYNTALRGLNAISLAALFAGVGLLLLFSV